MFFSVIGMAILGWAWGLQSEPGTSLLLQLFPFLFSYLLHRNTFFLVSLLPLQCVVFLEIGLSDLAFNPM